jgi:hypothetical protein
LVKPFFNVVTDFKSLLGLLLCSIPAKDSYGLSRCRCAEDDTVIINSNIFVSGIFGAVLSTVDDLDIGVVSFKGQFKLREICMYCE